MKNKSPADKTHELVLKIAENSKNYSFVEIVTALGCYSAGLIALYRVDEETFIDDIKKTMKMFEARFKDLNK